MLVKLLKSLLPRKVKDFILAVLDGMSTFALKVFSSHPWLANIYYLFSQKFAREHQAVLKGRLAFRYQQGLQGSSHTLLRRNIHRIEKGLIMRPRKPVFAVDYIEQTIEAFTAAVNNQAHCTDELSWACDVLTAYFKTCDYEAESWLALKDKFEQLSARVTEARGNDVPYAFASKVNAGLSIEQFESLCVQRRSVRWFKEQSVDMTLIEQAVKCAALAPSACNRQPFSFYIANDPMLAKELVAIPMGTKGFSQNVPCTIVVSADLACYPTERDRHLIYIDSALASMQLMLALETLGLSSCPINWPDIEPLERKMAECLDLPVSKRPIMLIAVGYALEDGQIPFSQKKSPAQLIHKVVR